MVAQALLEKGILESATLGVSTFVWHIGNIVQAQPYLTTFIVVAVVYLLIRRR